MSDGFTLAAQGWRVVLADSADVRWVAPVVAWSWNTTNDPNIARAVPLVPWLGELKSAHAAADLLSTPGNAVTVGRLLAPGMVLCDELSHTLEGWVKVLESVGIGMHAIDNTEPPWAAP